MERERAGGRGRGRRRRGSGKERPTIGSTSPESTVSKLNCIESNLFF
mgnify:CR=1 FL=1